MINYIYPCIGTIIITYIILIVCIIIVLLYKYF